VSKWQVRQRVNKMKNIKSKKLPTADNLPENDLEAIKQAVGERVKAEQEANTETEGRENRGNESPYFLHKGYLCRTKTGRNGEDITIRLCNFSAKIIEENIVDDGREISHFFTVGGMLKNKFPLAPLEIPAALFQGMTWIPKWGSKPTLEPGATIRDFVRHSIQSGSNDVKVKTHYGHTGWKEIAGQWVYLHTGGAIGSAEEISVRLPRGLDKYFLPPPAPYQTRKRGRGRGRVFKNKLIIS